MGNVSIIARRLDENYIQYGWSGNGGYYLFVGARLLEWYKEADKVDYLFDLGQTELIGLPGSEDCISAPKFYTHKLTGEPFWVGKSEKEMFSKIAFVDHGYFFDSDNLWYYIIPGPFRIKIPLEVIANNLDDEGYEFAYCREIEKGIIEFIFDCYINQDSIFADLLKTLGQPPEGIKERILKTQFPIKCLYEDYREIFCYFNNWVVALSDDNMTKIVGYIIKPQNDSSAETITWK